MVFLSGLESSSCLSSVLFGSRTFLVMRWMMPEALPREVASCCLYLAAGPSHVGVEVDGLAYPLHRPMACSCSRGDRAYLLGVILSCHCSRWCCLSGEGKLPGCRYLMESLFASISILLNIHTINHFY
jgi:hypothetical protein